MSEIDIGIIRFIKLASKNDNKKYKKDDGLSIEAYCLEKGKMVLGYHGIEHFENYKSLDHESLKKEIIEKYKSKPGPASNHARQITNFYENNESTLWITFAKKRLWWGFVDTSKGPGQDENGFTYRDMLGNWKSEDLNGVPLTFENVSGALLKTQGYQGTICDITDNDSFPIQEYTKRLINGKKLSQVVKAEKRKKAIEKSMADLVMMLHPKDFEYIVDLIFQYSGWKKLTPGAGNEKFIDLDLLMPLTNERAVVQIKSTTNQAQYDEYENEFDNHDIYDRFFYVYHTSKNDIKPKSGKKPIHIMGICQIAELIVELGLVSILMKKVS